MLAPVKWLKDFVDIDLPIEDLCDKMTMTGTKVEGYLRKGEDVKGVVVGKILSVDSHPDADKLVVCKVDTGNEVIQIVTGAPNVEPGQLVPVATHGAILPGGMKIKKGKLRGVESHGMMCSGEELQLTDADYPGAEVYGIMILKEEYPLGMDIREALDLVYDVIDFEITSNRPDCLSIIGIARETAVTTGKQFRNPTINVKEGIGNIKDEASVIVKEPELCPRYAARVIKDIKIEPSPQWMRRRLAAAGVRPINNIVDITNYVMLEMGQPMHAFDIDKLSGKSIIVRRAEDGEKITTLDDKERILTKDMLVIADEEKAIAIAGVMGGAETEISEGTKSILLESAQFNGASVRLTSKALGLRSEASSRFEKGLDIHTVIKALDRAAELIQELGAGVVVNDIIDVCSGDLSPKIIDVSWMRVNDLSGLDLDVDNICEILKSLDFQVETRGETLRITIPSYRGDVEGVADITEEIARIYGYDNIPLTLMEGSASKASKTHKQRLVDKAKEILVGMGLYETVTYSFVSPRVYESLGYAKEDVPLTVKIANPLGEDQSIMRTTLISSILEVISRNSNRRLQECRIFEMANIYEPKSSSLNELPIETLTLTMGEYGMDSDFYSLKGKVESFLGEYGLSKGVSFVPAKHPAFHPGRTATIQFGNTYIGVIGEIHPRVRDNFEIDRRTFVAELNMDAIMDISNTERKYVPLPKYPAITRDLALVVDKSVLAAQVEGLIYQAAGKLLEDIKLFDIYEGSQIPEGSKSLAYSLSFRAQDRTLKDEEVNSLHEKVVKLLEEKLNAKLR